MMKIYENGFWIWNTDLDRLKSILLRDARNETAFTRRAISDAIDNKKATIKPPTRAELELAEALDEDLL